MACVPLLSVAKVSIYKSSNEREERKKMKKIRKLINVALLLVDVCLLGACGKSASSEQDSDVNESFDGYNNENDSSDTVDVENQEKPEEAEKAVEIREAVPFSDGLAWIQLANEDNWKCIDEDGNVLFEEEYGWPDEFIGDYTVVDNAVVIDNKGKLLYDFKSEGYELVDSQPLDVGCVILQKELDTYEKSGTFMYVLDVNEKKITEIDLSECAYFTKGDGGYWENEKIQIVDYLGNGYFTIGDYDILDDDFGIRSFGMIQWYDVKNNKYVDIGNFGYDEDVGNVTTYYKTSNPDVFCVHIGYIPEFYFVNIRTSDVENVIEYGEQYLCKYSYLGDNIIKYYKNIEDEIGSFLDIDTQETFTMIPDFEDYDILSYNGNCFCVSLTNDIGTHYLAVVDKSGQTIFDPVEYDSESDFKPCFWGNDFIFYNGEEMCFVDTTSWKIESQIVMDIGNSDDDDEDALWKRMCLMDANSPEVKYVVDLDKYSYYLPDGSEVAVETDNYPTVISVGIFESKLLVWHNGSQSYQFLNNDLTPFQIKFK